MINDGAPLPGGFGRPRIWERRKLAYSERMRWLTKAPQIPGSSRLPPRRSPIRLRSRRENRAPGTVVLHTNGADSIALVAPEKANIRAAGIGGFVRPFDKTAEGRSSIACFGRSCDGATLTIVFGNSEPVEFTLVGTRLGLPTNARPLLRARPKFARPQYVPDETVTLTRVWL